MGDVGITAEASARRAEAESRFDALVAPGGMPAAASVRAVHPQRPSAADSARRPRRGTTVIALCGLLAAAGVIAGSLLVTSGSVRAADSSERLAGVTSSALDANELDAKKSTAAPTAPGTAALGSVATLSPTISVYVSQPTGFVPGRRASGVTQSQSLVYTITVTNTGADAAAPGLVVSAASGTTPASPIADAVNGLRVGVGARALEGGESRTYRVAFSAASSETSVTVSSSGGIVTFS